MNVNPAYQQGYILHKQRLTDSPDYQA